MKLGENILKARKQQGLSQEQLGSLVNVTRQTISNWELGETSPNPEQLKLLSSSLNISVDELIGNDINRVLEVKISNTEKLAGLIIKILKAIGILFIISLIICIIGNIMFLAGEKPTISNSETIELFCSLNENKYLIKVGTDGYFNCLDCPTKIQDELKDNYIDFENMSKTTENISNYFKNNNGTCD